MSTGYENTTANRIAKLAKMGETLLHTQDFSTLWGIKNKNHLYTTLKRYAQRGLLYRIHKGFYSLKDLKYVNKYLLGIKSLNQYAYISTETVLAEHSVIFQLSSIITIVSAESKKFTIQGNQYQSRQLSDKYLYNDIGVILQDGYYKATLERAVADMLYFNPMYFFDNKEVIDWDKVNEIQKLLGYK